VGFIDTAILFAYLALMVALGFYAQHRQQGIEDYFVAGRRMGPVTIACLWVAAWVGGAAVVGSSTRAFERGVTGGWYVAAQAIGCLLFGLFMAARVKRIGDRHGHLTYPDFIEQHYDGRTRLVATVTTVLAFTAYSAGQLVAAAAMLQVLLGWDYDAALLLAGAIVIVYTAAGGYLAVTYTDWVQVVLLLGGVVAIGIPVAIERAGSWSDLQAALPPSYFELGAQGWDRIAALVVSMVLSFFVGMDSFSRCYAARSESAARNGALLAVLPILPLAVAGVWLGLACAVLYPHAEVSNGVLTTFVVDSFPTGLKGLVLVGILSAVMSTADICILTASANYARDIHQRYLWPQTTPRAMLRVGTVASVVAGLAAMLLAWKMQDIIGVLQLGFTINSAALFLPTIAAVYWNNVRPSAAFWSIGLSLATVIGWHVAASSGAGGWFAIDPLWPGLLVSAAVLLVLNSVGAKRAPETAR
jgi:solute:Na+ symporter, SSS family